MQIQEGTPSNKQREEGELGRGEGKQKVEYGIRRNQMTLEVSTFCLRHLKQES